MLAFMTSSKTYIYSPLNLWTFQRMKNEKRNLATHKINYKNIKKNKAPKKEGKKSCWVKLKKSKTQDIIQIETSRKIKRGKKDFLLSNNFAKFFFLSVYTQKSPFPFLYSSWKRTMKVKYEKSRFFAGDYSTISWQILLFILCFFSFFFAKSLNVRIHSRLIFIWKL